jgi:hypothetical protein
MQTEYRATAGGAAPALSQHFHAEYFLLIETLNHF